MITGQAPPEATERMQRDSLRLPSQVVPANLEKALLKGLALKVEDRFADMRALQQGFSGAPSAPAYAQQTTIATHEKLLYKDPQTGLVWPVNGNIAGRKMTWEQAKSWANSLNYAGYTDWRLPTKEELSALTKKGGKNPSDLFNANGFSCVQSGGYWTSTIYNDLDDFVFIIHLSDGYVGQCNNDSFNYVWPVCRK